MRSRWKMVLSAGIAVLLLIVIYHYAHKFRSTSGATGLTPEANTGANAQPKSEAAPGSWNAPMAVAFNTGGLPQALPTPIGDLDQAAATLAKQVAAADENSTPALLTALQLAGFSIRGKDGKITHQPTGPSQGIALDAWQVAAMAKLYGNGAALTLTDLGVVLSKMFPSAEKVPITDLLIGSIRSAAAGEKHSRFLARFIAELGRNAGQPYDLLGQKVDASSVQIDAIQQSLIIVRLAADLSTVEPATSPRTKPAAWEEAPGFNSSLEFRPAVFHPGEARLLQVDEENGSDIPCKLEEWQLTWLDATAIADGVLFDGLLEALKRFDFAEQYKPFRRYANIVLVLAKAIWTYAALNVDMTMENSPLIRTKDTDKGQTRVLNAHISYNIDKWQILNCVRPFLGLAGLDFGNLPSHGDAAGAGVEWILLQGGADLGSGFHRITSRDLGKYLQAVHSAFVFFDNGSGSEGETWSTVADDHGIATIKVTGAPQTQDISHYHLVPSFRTMSLQVNIKVKVADKGTKLLGEFLDVLGPALGASGTNAGGENSDLLSAVVAAITETLYRMHWYGSQAFDFPVQDWTIADGSWHGIIHSTMTYKDDPPANIIVDSVGRTATMESTHRNSEATVFINGGSKTGDLQGTLSVTADSVRVDDGSFQQYKACGPGGAPQLKDYRVTKKELRASMPVTIHVALNDVASAAAGLDQASAQLPDSVKEFMKQQAMETQVNQDLHYSISVIAQIPHGTYTQVGYRRATGYCDGYHPSNTVNESGMDEVESAPTGVEGTFDPKTPNSLKGSVDNVDSTGKTHVHITWDLQR